MSVTSMRCIGDTLILGINVPSLDKDDPIPMHYKSIWIDMPTEFTYIIHHDNEMDMLSFISKWEICDDDDEAYDAISDKFTGKAREMFLP